MASRDFHDLAGLYFFGCIMKLVSLLAVSISIFLSSSAGRLMQKTRTERESYSNEFAASRKEQEPTEDDVRIFENKQHNSKLRGKPSTIFEKGLTMEREV